MNDATPESTHRDFPTWEQSASMILYCFASCVGEQLLSYIRDAKTPKGAWENLKKIFAASTTARKLKLRQELSNLRQRDLSVADYTSKIKDICDSLASIDVNIKESEMVQVCLGGLASKFGAFRMAVHSTSTHTDSKMLYTEGDRPRGRGGRGESVRNGGGG